MNSEEKTRYKIAMSLHVDLAIMFCTQLKDIHQISWNEKTKQTSQWVNPYISMTRPWRHLFSLLPSIGPPSVITCTCPLSPRTAADTIT